MFLRLLLNTLFGCAMPKFFFGIGQGPSSEEKQMYKLLSGIAGYGFGKGTTATNQGLDYFSAIASGDPTKIAQAIAPETRVIQGQAEQRKKQLAEFGTRSGGTAAAAANIDTDTLAQIQNLVNTIRPQAESTLLNEGNSLLSLGSGAGSSGFDAAKVMQGQNAAKWNDIFKSIAEIVTGGMNMASSPATATIH